MLIGKYLKILIELFVYVKINVYLCIEINNQTKNNMEELDYNKEFKSGNTIITRGDYESMPSPMNTSSLSDEDMGKLADAIEHEMHEWEEWLYNGDINQEQYDEHWWQVMEELALNFGMTYYEDEE